MVQLLTQDNALLRQGNELISCADTSGCCVPAQTQACCIGQDCFDLTPEDCLAIGGNPIGAGTSCATTQCPTNPNLCCDECEICPGSLAMTVQASPCTFGVDPGCELCNVPGITACFSCGPQTWLVTQEGPEACRWSDIGGQNLTCGPCPAVQDNASIRCNVGQPIVCAGEGWCASGTLKFGFQNPIPQCSTLGIGGTFAFGAQLSPGGPNCECPPSGGWTLLAFDAAVMTQPSISVS